VITFMINNPEILYQNWDFHCSHCDTDRIISQTSCELYSLSEGEQNGMAAFHSKLNIYILLVNNAQQFFIPTHLWRWNRQGVPKRWHINLVLVPCIFKSWCKEPTKCNKTYAYVYMHMILCRLHCLYVYRVEENKCWHFQWELFIMKGIN
jgi:hypothetical protein